MAPHRPEAPQTKPAQRSGGIFKRGQEANEARMDSEEEIVLVTPVWNDSARLAVFGHALARALAGAGLPLRWVIADDGSCSEEKSRLAALQQEFSGIYERVELMLFSPRSRKGGAVYQAWDACPGAAWLVFSDADGAITPEVVLALIQEAISLGSSSAVVGVRRHTKASPLRRSRLRNLSFYLFNSLVQAAVGIRFKDTQCGVKVVDAEAYRAVTDRLVEKGFAFDVELLVALESQGTRIREAPIPWQEVGGGKVSPWRDSWAMLAALFRIRRRFRQGLYTKKEELEAGS